jgi:hypothetical protein
MGAVQGATMATFEMLRANLLSPIPLAFALGVLARVLRSDLALPKDLYTSLSIYLLFALGLRGGVELAHAPPGQLALPIVATVALGVLTPLVAYAATRLIGRFAPADAAAMAAHYGSVSAVTFIAAQQYVQDAGSPAEGFMPTLLTVLESPGILVGLSLGAMQRGDDRAPASTRLARVVHEIATGRTMVLLLGGLAVGYTMGTPGWRAVSPFFEGGFKGALMLFLLEMGLVAGERLGDLRRAGGFLLGFGIVVPILHGALGVLLARAAGLSVGGATVLGAMAASASYIAAPPAVRMTLPEANPTFTLTAALGITFPFNLLAGIPLYHRIAMAVR